MCQLRCGGKALASRIQYPPLLDPGNRESIVSGQATVERPPEVFKLSDQSLVGPPVHALWLSSVAEGGASALQAVPDQSCSIEDPVERTFSLALICQPKTNSAPGHRFDKKYRPGSSPACGAEKPNPSSTKVACRLRQPDRRCHAVSCRLSVGVRHVHQTANSAQSRRRDLTAGSRPDVCATPILPATARCQTDLKFARAEFFHRFMLCEPLDPPTILTAHNLGVALARRFFRNHL